MTAEETLQRQESYTLRPLLPTDGKAIQELNSQTPDTGTVRFVAQYHYDAYEVLCTLHQGMTGVVAEAPDHEGIVGLGLVSVGECQYEGEMRPSAYLSTLSVHPDYRRRGIASKLALWRFERAREHFERMGSEGVVFAGVQQGNTGSLQTAVRWSNQRLDGRSFAGVTSVRTRPPRPLDGVEVRPARQEEFEEIAEKQNRFYREFNFYAPETGEELSKWRAEQPLGLQLRDYLVAVDRGGNILAGLSVVEYGRLISDHLVRLPLPLKVANVFLKVLPADGVSKRIRVERLWFDGENVAACRHLWEAARWLLRDRGTMLMTFYDAQSPLNVAISLPRFVPKVGGSLVLRGPVPATEGRPIYFQP